METDEREKEEKTEGAAEEEGWITKVEGVMFNETKETCLQQAASTSGSN